METGTALVRQVETSAGSAPVITILGDLGHDYIYTCPLLQGGREMIIRSFQQTLAGAAGYVSTGLARLGATVHLLTEVGDDPAGQALREEARGLGIRPEGIRVREGAASPFTMIFAEEAEESPRQVATYLGTLADLSVSSMDLESLLPGTSLVYSCNYFLLPKLREEIGEVFERARSLGILTAYDANAGDGWDSPRALETLTERIYPHTDVVFLNESEAAALSGGREPEEALADLSPGSGTVVVKLGPRGVILRHRGAVYGCSAFPVAGPVRDTVGAGDSFQAAFLYFLTLGFPAERCAILGAANGASSVQHTGGVAGQLDRRGLAAFISRYRIEERRPGRFEILPRG